MSCHNSKNWPQRNGEKIWQKKHSIHKRTESTKGCHDERRKNNKAIQLIDGRCKFCWEEQSKWCVGLLQWENADIQGLCLEI